jgi:hypothetical protein
MTAKPDPLELRKRLTFEQAEGAEPLPAQLKPKEISKSLRARLWEVIHRSIDGSRYRTVEGDTELIEPWESISYHLHDQREHEMVDEFENDFDTFVQKSKRTIAHGDYLQVFGWIQYVSGRRAVLHS